MTTYQIPGEDIWVIPHFEHVPGLGHLAMHSYLIRGREPVLVDTGPEMSGPGFFDALWSLIDPQDLRWVFMSHEDADHTGHLAELLRQVPKARLVSNFVGMAKTTGALGLGPDRYLLVNSGQEFEIAGRRFVDHRPPVYDSGASHALFDVKSRAYLCADAFGAIISRPVENLGDLAPGEWREGYSLFNRANSPWLAVVDQARLGHDLDSVRRLEARWILSAHLPPAPVSMGNQLLDELATLPAQGYFVGPDQAAMEASVAAIHGGEPIAANP
jgi:hypothetical protein